MSKKQQHEQKLAEISASTEKFRAVAGVVGKGIFWGSVVACAYFVSGSTTVLDVKAAFSGEINRNFMVLLLAV